MGSHYGDNVTLPGPGHLPAQAARSAAPVGRASTSSTRTCGRPHPTTVSARASPGSSRWSHDQSDDGRSQRRRFLTGAGACGSRVPVPCRRSSTCCDQEHASGLAVPLAGLRRRPPRPAYPVRQHAWNGHTGKLDEYGNSRCTDATNRLLFFGVQGHGAERLGLCVGVLEAELRKLEHAQYAWGPRGSAVHGRLGVTPTATPERVARTQAPIPACARLCRTSSQPKLRHRTTCVCTWPAMTSAGSTLIVLLELLQGPHALTSRRSCAWRQHSHRIHRRGVASPPTSRFHLVSPAGNHGCPSPPPLYMGFKSNAEEATRRPRTRSRSPSGDFAEGTTMAVSYMTLSLDSWYSDLTQEQRVQRMYSPQTSLAEQRRFTTEAEGNPDKLNQAISHYGVIGHAQSSARARRNNKAIILRRDFDTTDGNPGRAALRLAPARRPGLRGHPHADEPERGVTGQPRPSPRRPTTASTSSSSWPSAATT